VSTSEARATLGGMADSRIEKWLRWCEDEIRPEVLLMYLQRDVFRTVGKTVEDNTSLPPSYYFDYLRDTYATTQAVGIRRQAETRSGVITLGRLITEIASDAGRFTREFWVGLWGNDDARRFGIPDRAFTDQFAPDGGDHLDPEIPKADLLELAWVAAEVKVYVDQHVAHNDAKPAAALPTFDDLDACIDLLGDLFKKYANLLTASSWLELVPVLQHDWQAVFRQPWLR
jgi:hypothetical protein